MAKLGSQFSHMGDKLRLGTKYDFKPDTNCVGEKNLHDWVEAHITKMAGDGKNVLLSISYRYCNDNFEEVKNLIYPNPNMLECGAMIKQRNNCSKRVNVK